MSTITARIPEWFKCNTNESC